MQKLYLLAATSNAKPFSPCS